MARNMRGIIVREAIAAGLDPRAVLAVAAGEGGFVNRANDVGDLGGGGSYGPFQLYARGALPARFRGKPAQADTWAWSPAGIRYALGRMVSAGAAGLTGTQAINTIIRKFERPKDPTSSVANAVSRLSQPGFRPQDIKAQASQAYAQGPANIVNSPSPAALLSLRQQQVMGLLQSSQNIIAGDFASNWAIIDQLNAARTAMWQASEQMAAAEADARATGGSALPNGPGVTISDPVMGRILQVADAQIGKPYVWGGESPQEGGFDCSGLIDWAYRQAGIRLPGRLTTQSAMKLGISVKGQPLQPGDWIFTNGGKHMVMYMGNGQVVAAPHSGATVRYQPVVDFQGDIVDVRRYNVQRAARRGAK